MATGPEIRVGNADREAVAAGLREHYAQGRLTMDEFNQRLDAAFAAATERDLRAVTRDLPPAAVPAAPREVAVAGAGRERARRDRAGYRGLGMIGTIVAVVTAWLLVFDLSLRVFPWPGKLAIFFLVFGVARRLLRRVFGGGRGYRGCGRW
jgi:Domain of unknown function (DUF1707)